MFFIPDVFLLWFQNGEIRGPRVSVGGAPVLGTDGTPVMRDALKLADEATITARMNAIPHSNYRAVVFTKEQYARTPLRDDSLLSMPESRQVNRGRSATDVKGAWLR